MCVCVVVEDRVGILELVLSCYMYDWKWTMSPWAMCGYRNHTLIQGSFYTVLIFLFDLGMFWNLWCSRESLWVIVIEGI